MQDEISFVGAFVIDFVEVELIIGCIDVGLDRQISSVDVPVLRYLRAEDQFWAIRTAVVPRFDVLRTIVYNQSVQLITHPPHLLPSIIA